MRKRNNKKNEKQKKKISVSCGISLCRRLDKRIKAKQVIAWLVARIKPTVGTRLAHWEFRCITSPVIKLCSKSGSSSNVFNAKKLSTLCSAHFDESCFEHKPVVTRTNDGKGKVIKFVKRLIKSSIPSRYTANLQTSKRINIHDKTTLVSHFFVFCGFINEENILFNYRKVVHHVSYAHKISFHALVVFVFTAVHACPQYQKGNPRLDKNKPIVTSLRVGHARYIQSR